MVSGLDIVHHPLGSERVTESGVCSHNIGIWWGNHEPQGAGL
jgi:hypothetical protein